MLDPNELYVVHQSDGQDAAPSLERPVLVHALTGFIDAGSAGRLLRDHLLENFEHRLLATFDVDQLLDYRSRRPTMVFVENHWVSYDEPVLLLHVIEDAAGVPFLLLEGAEPDVQWERFMQAVLHLVETLDVRLSIGVHGIPMGLPHTRPTGVTAHAARLELVAGHPPWIGTVQVPGSVGNLLEYRLGQAGHDAMGFAVHVPHYLAQTDYPDAALVLLDAVAKAGDLTLPGQQL
ncbi:MAG: PAC2 family protein, partial [Sporichthyaceae bacterium]